MNGITYIAHKDGDELAHYGVKGQKWGVRKEIARDARGAATAGRNSRINRKLSSKLERMGSSKFLTKNKRGTGKTLKGVKRGLSKALLSASKRREISADKFEKIQKTLSKGLSKADIAQGENYMRKSAIVYGILATPLVGVGVVGLNQYRVGAQARKHAARNED